MLTHRWNLLRSHLYQIKSLQWKVANEVPKLGSLKMQDINGMIDRMRKNNEAPFFARILVHFIDIVCKMARWNFQIYSFNGNVNTQQ